MNIDLFHALEGKNIYFKALNTRDEQAIHDYASDEDVSRFIGWSLMRTLDETREFIELMIKRESEGTHLYASVALKSTREVIGTVMIFNFDRQANQAEVGYVFHKDHWGKGYGTESLMLLSDFAFETLQLHKLHASVTDANVGSARILEKSGYTLEGRLRDHYFTQGRYYDALLLGKIRHATTAFTR